MLLPRARSRSVLPCCKKGPARSATRTAGSGRGLRAGSERSGGARSPRVVVVEEDLRTPLAVESGVRDRAAGDRQSRGDRHWPAGADQRGWRTAGRARHPDSRSPAAGDGPSRSPSTPPPAAAREDRGRGTTRPSGCGRWSGPPRTTRAPRRSRSAAAPAGSAGRSCRPRPGPARGRPGAWPASA